MVSTLRLENATSIQNPRLVEVTTALAAVVQQELRESGVTEVELAVALEFLSRVAAAGELGLLSDALGFSRIVDDNSHAYEQQGGTAANILGPYYRPDAPFMANGESLAPPDESGEPLLVAGTVSSVADGSPIAGAALDVWQANARGEYEHQAPGAPDYYLRRRLRSDAQGNYSLRTVRPSPYEIPKSGPVGELLARLGWHAFRPAHVHFKIDAEGFRPLVTQMYFIGGDYLQDDRVSAAKPELAVTLARADGVDIAHFDVRLVPSG